MVESDVEVAARAVGIIASIQADPNGDRRRERGNDAAACARAAAVASRHVATTSPTRQALRAAELAENLASSAEKMAVVGRLCSHLLFLCQGGTRRIPKGFMIHIVTAGPCTTVYALENVESLVITYFSITSVAQFNGCVL